MDFITSGWAPRESLGITEDEVAAFSGARREALSARFPGARLVIPAGSYKVRTGDTDYRFRPHSAFAHLTGLGLDLEPDAVLVLHPLFADDDGDGEPQPVGHEAVLYARPPSSFESDEFFADSRYGEYWIGARPMLEDLETKTGIPTRNIDGMRDALSKDAGGEVQLLVVPEADEAVETLVEAVRLESGAGDPPPGTPTNADLGRATSEIRLVKDAWEIEQMREAVNQTIDGFAAIVQALPSAVDHARGERVVETVFDAHARLEGNTVGYDTIAASGNNATTLHWITNDGPVRPGDLLLVDAGVEVESLYTADITRTLPVSGTFTAVQRKVYQAVLDAADTAFRAAVPGAQFKDVHAAAMDVIAARLEEWGILPDGITAAESLEPDCQYHRRWMVHGTSHHLGLDVHDCAQARASLYKEGVLTPGMIFTIEPGLYFKSGDLTVPEEYRGIGVRIEDDILITDNGAENLSVALPRDPDAVEAWMASLMGA